MSLRVHLIVQDADNATVHWALEPIRRPKAGTGPGSARPKAGTACTGARECRPKAGTGRHWGRPKAGTGLHWGHVGVPCCRPKAGAGWAEGPALRRAQCARGAVSSALCTARGSAVCEPYIYYYIYCYNIQIYVLYCGIYILFILERGQRYTIACVLYL